MIVVLGDLHFQDTNNDIVRDGGGKEVVKLDRNVSEKAFRFIFDELLDIASKVRAKELNVVLAGDIFDLNRSQRWFEGSIRPYGGNTENEWLPIVRTILDDICASNEGTFAVFSEYAARTTDKGVKMTFTYLPGNHDRLINLHPDLRKRVRQILGSNGNDDSPFAHTVALANYGVHIRHGHEYDQNNFAGKIPKDGPLNPKNNDYDAAPMGDFITIDIATRIAYAYRKKFEKEIIAGSDNGIHRVVYQKLLEFDNLRPLSDLISFMKAELADGDRVMDEYFMPVVKDVLGQALKSEFLKKWQGWLTITVGNILRFLSPKMLLSFITSRGSDGPMPWEFAMREPALIGDSTPFRYLVAGHTHNPDVEYLHRSNDGQERFFIDTGTWRQQIRKCKDNTTFARAKALTYAIFYSPDKDIIEAKRFDYWDGFTKTQSV